MTHEKVFQLSTSTHAAARTRKLVQRMQTIYERPGEAATVGRHGDEFTQRGCWN
jgi:hypothetical protein